MDNSLQLQATNDTQQIMNTLGPHVCTSLSTDPDDDDDDVEEANDGDDKHELWSLSPHFSQSSIDEHHDLLQKHEELHDEDL